MPDPFVIVGSDGTEHEFPSGMDPKRAAEIVRQQEEQSQTVPAPAPSLASKAGHVASELLPAAGGVVGSIAGGPIGAAVGGAAGQGYKTLTASLGELAPALKDVAAGLYSHPRETMGGFVQGAEQGAQDAGIQGAIQGASAAAGNAIGWGMAKVAPRLMQSAVKPALATLKEYQTSAPKIVQTLLDEGVNVTQSGLSKLQGLLAATNDEIKAAVAGATGSINKTDVATRVLPTAGKVAAQVNPGADLRAVGKAVTGFMDHPVATGSTLTVPEAQAMKVGTYEQIGKKYGEVSAAGIEAQKALARGLKEEIEAKVPFIAKLNQKDSELMAAMDAVGRRVALAGNKDPIGFAWVTHNPISFLAALMDREPVVKSMLARGMYKSAAAAGRVSEQAIRAAVAALATSGESESSPLPGSTSGQ